MQNNKKRSALLFTAVFILCIGVIGVLSFRRLVRFYVNDEVDYNDWTADLGSRFESDVASTFFEKFQFVNLNGAVRRLLGQQEMNGVVKLDNGYLYTTMEYIEDETLKEYAESVATLSDYVTAHGKKLLFAITPCTSSKYDPELPAGVADYGNDDADRLVNYLQQEGVETLDYREIMHEDGIDQYDMMYKTDHHWTTECGLYAYGKLEDAIVAATGCSVDERIRDISQYTITTYPKWHLGSRGQRTGRYFAGIDDFDLVVPNFEIRLLADDGNIAPMQDMIYNYAPLSDRNYTSRYTYDSVLGGAMGHYINQDCPNDVKLLVITDSMGSAVNPFLAMGFSEIKCIHDRSASELTPEVLDSYDPDVVVLLYYLGNAVDGTGFDFSGF